MEILFLVIIYMILSYIFENLVEELFLIIIEFD
jgi:hypothetical protein